VEHQLKVLAMMIVIAVLKIKRVIVITIIDVFEGDYDYNDDAS
jgi:hypothetical protein